MLDDFDREAMREGFAMSRIRGYTSNRKGRVIVKANNRQNVERCKEPDILRILGVIHGPDNTDDEHT